MSKISEDQLHLASSLEFLRNEISGKRLCLFLGEQLSALPLKDLKGLFNLIKNTPSKELMQLVDRIENECEESSYHIHHILRSVGCFPVIMTVCVDQFTEQHLIRDKQKVDKIRLDHLSDIFQEWPVNDRTLLIKCLGDTSLNPSLMPKTSCCDLYESLPNDGSDIAKVLKDFFGRFTFLFFGVQGDDPIQSEILNHFIKQSTRPHYLFETGTTTECIRDGSLTVLKANTSADEFAQYLSSGEVVQYSLEDLKGKVHEVSFLPTQREQYLLQQLYLEQQSVEIGIQTVKITNALSTDELLNKESRPAIQKIFENDPFMGQWNDRTVDSVMNAMFQRRDNLLKVSSLGTSKVVAVFSFQAFLGEIGPQKSMEERQMAVRKYTTVILNSCTELHSSYNLWLRAIPPDQEADTILKEKFGIFRLRGGQDEGIAYAEPAIVGKKSYTSHFLSINGPEVLRKRRIFERSLTLAWDHQRTVFELTVAVLKENRLVNGLSDYERQCLESLQSVQVLSEMNLITGSFERISEGSFGEVFKAKWKKNGVVKNVAVKILKNISSVVDLDNYRREYESMKVAKHPNIVEIYEPYRSNNQLGLIMEFMEGGSVRDVINKNLGVGLSKDFTQNCARQVASALAYLHEQSIWHRDIKVDNIFLSGDHQTIKIGDFGLAKLKADTRNTNTQDIGSYRYMAPEVASGAAMGKYSAKADVYSYGLMLAEIMMGNLVFNNIPIHQEVYRLKLSGDLPVSLPENSEELYGAVLCSVVKGCVQRNPQFRPTIQQVLDLMDGRQDISSNRYTPSNGLHLLCLGTGKGATAVIHNEPSSSFVLLNDGQPLLLVDMGLGVLYSYRTFLGDKLPENIFLTHNHSDHTGDLPVFFGILAPKLLKSPKKLLNVIAAPEVMSRVKDYRMHEIVSQVETLTKVQSVDPLANWTISDPDSQTILYLDEKKEFGIKTVLSQHSEICYGFVLYQNNHPIVGYSADSGYNEHLYSTVFEADMVIVDARTSGSFEHASFAEVSTFAQSKKHKNVYVIGYGKESEAPSVVDYPNLKVLETGTFYSLDLTDKLAQLPNNSTEYPSLEEAVGSQQ